MRQHTMWIVLGVLLGAILALAGCGGTPAPSTSLPAAPTVAAPTAPTPAIQPPSSGCQSRIWGSVSAGGAGEANVTVEIKGESWNAKTPSDANGLYGFAGLCAGKYTLTIVPPSGATAGESQTVTVDGSNTVKLDLVFRKP